MNTKNKKFILFYIIFILSLLFIIIKSNITVQIIFNSIDEHILYCDDNINFYNTSNLNVYKISENGNFNNVYSQLKMKQDINATPKNFRCQKSIYYSTNSNNEKLLIELINPQNLNSLFLNSTASYIEIKTGNFENYEDYGLMFSYCQNLISIDLSNFSFKKTKYIHTFFYICKNLETIIWPNNKENFMIEFNVNMFTGCSKLTSIDLSFFDFSKVTIMNNFFAFCSNLEKVKFPNKKFSLTRDISSMFYGCNKLTSIDLSNFGFNKTYNMSYLFYNCEKLNTIIWPKEIFYSSYDYCTYSHMFSNCHSLTSIDLSNFYIQRISDLSYMFSNCINLQNIKLNGYLDWVNDQVSVYIWYFDSNMTIKSSTNIIFQSCSSLKELNLLSININYNNEFFNNINNLEGCYFHEYNSNMKKCSNYMGFYYCGNCNNDNIDEYCTKEIQGINYNFYYYFGQSELSYDKKQCFWSNKN